MPEILLDIFQFLPRDEVEKSQLVNAQWNLTIKQYSSKFSLRLFDSLEFEKVDEYTPANKNKRKYSQILRKAAKRNQVVKYSKCQPTVKFYRSLHINYVAMNHIIQHDPNTKRLQLEIVQSGWIRKCWIRSSRMFLDKENEYHVQRIRSLKDCIFRRFFNCRFDQNCNRTLRPMTIDIFEEIKQITSICNAKIKVIRCVLNNCACMKCDVYPELLEKYILAHEVKFCAPMAKLQNMKIKNPPSKIDVDCACNVCLDDGYSSDDMENKILGFIESKKLYEPSRFNLTFFGSGFVLTENFFQTLIKIFMDAENPYKLLSNIEISISNSDNFYEHMKRWLSLRGYYSYYAIPCEFNCINTSELNLRPLCNLTSAAKSQP
uniref:F-box domain-containing protein n=1 Tax=Acrobeloides nanus TaxID=290746 RepID=A0A914ECH3_9BILA